MGRAPCCEKVGLNRGAWTREEDLKLMQYIAAHGEGSWRTLPKAAGLLRCGKSCRLRWINYLRPDLKRGNITEEEDRLIIKLHSVLGNRWSLIAGRLPGRTDNEIKNYWNTHLKKKLKSMGIDPNTHRPLTLSININHSNTLNNNQKPSQNSNNINYNNNNNNNNNNDNVLLPGNVRSYLAAYTGKNNDEKGVMFSRYNIDKYEIDRYLSSATASAANVSVMRSANHFDYKAKPMFSLDCSTASDESSARAALVHSGTGSYVPACAAPPPGVTRCNSASSSSLSAPSPPSKNPAAQYNCQAAFPPPSQYTFSKDLAANPSPNQAFTQNPSSIQAPTKNPSPILQAVTENPSLFQAHTKNPSPIQSFTEHPALIQAHTKKATQAVNPSPLQAYLKNPSPLLALTQNPSSDEACTKNPSPVQAYTKNPSPVQAYTKNPCAGEAFAQNLSADQAYTKSAVMNINACSASTSTTSSFASVGYSGGDYNNNRSLALVADNIPLKPTSLGISDDSLVDIKENEGADTSVLSMLEADFMWDFDMGCMQPSGMEEEAHLPTPSTQELLQALWGPSNSWLSEQQDQKLA